ncbi:MAG: hypothetical protein AB1716_08220 [Planctomycetota bacterium]
MRVTCSYRVGVLVWACMCGSSASADLIVDDFTQGAVYLLARSPHFGGPPYAERLETGLAPQNTLNGRRLTWVAAGQDADPAIAELRHPAMWFNIDNDEGRGGLKYPGLGGLDLTRAGSLDRLALELDYLRPGEAGQYVSAVVTLRDTFGRERALSQTLGRDVAGVGWVGFSGTYGFALDAWAPVDLRSIADIELRFWGGPAFHDWFALSGLAIVPEPGGLLAGMVLGLRAWGWRGRSRA